MSRPTGRPAIALYGMEVNKELGTDFGGFIVVAKEVYAMNYMSVATYQIGAVFPHRRPQRPPFDQT